MKWSPVLPSEATARDSMLVLVFVALAVSAIMWNQSEQKLKESQRAKMDAERAALFAGLTNSPWYKEMQRVQRIEGGAK